MIKILGLKIVNSLMEFSKTVTILIKAKVCVTFYALDV